MDSILDQLAYGRSFMPGKGHPSGLMTATRLEPPQGIAVGYEDAFIASQDCVVTTKQISANRTFADEERGLGRIAFVFHLGGKRTVDISGLGKYPLNGPSFNIHYLPPGVTKRSTWAQGGRETAVVIGFWADRLPSVIREALGSNSMLSALDARADSEPIWLLRPLSLEMEQAARQILRPKIHASVLSNFLKAKANELLCLGLDSALFALNPIIPRANRLQSQVRHARRILEEEIQCPPSILELSRIVDLSANTLAREFCNAYGVSVPEYISGLRMNTAQHALVTTDLPLKRISYDVGYQHTSNFCAAFKRHFGRTPTEVRRAGQQNLSFKTLNLDRATSTRSRVDL